MSEDRIEAIKEFVSFLERKKDVNVSGDLYVGNVNFLLTENAELRATIADNGREIDKKNMEIEHWKGLATHGCSNEAECCPFYCMNEKAEAERDNWRDKYLTTRKEINDLRGENKVLREEENVPYLKALKENAELRERLKPLDDVREKWRGCGDDSYSRAKRDYDAWQAICKVVEGK